MSAINFIGKAEPWSRRFLTGFPSLDKAASGNGKLGFPVNTLTEIYGAPGIGKTTVMVSLAAVFARHLGGKIAFADFEGQSYEMVANALEMNGYVGDVDLLLRNGTKTNEDILDTMIEELHSPECHVAMLDSVGAFMPIAELEGSVADAVMGIKARTIGRWTGKVIYRLNLEGKPDAVCFYVSHQHPNFGFAGVHTGGGEKKRFLNAQQLELKKKDDYETGWLIEGKLKKARHGITNNYFRMFIIGGQGAHTGLSAVFDCVSAGLAEIERNVVKMTDGERTQSFGKIQRMIENWQDRELFAPFTNALIARDMPQQEEEPPVDEIMVGEEPKKRDRKKGA